MSDSRDFQRHERVTWLRYPHGGGEPVPVPATVAKTGGARVGVLINVGGKMVKRSARPEHLRRRT